MIRRTLQAKLVGAARRYPVVTLTGPRQSGKTTLCRAAFPRKPYVSLEPMDQREYARSDPRGFLAAHPDGAVIDEFQHAPDLASYIQEIVDDRPTAGRYVLTGSQNLAVVSSVSQSLAGRTAVLTLLPLSLDEVRRFPRGADDLFELLVAGGYPRIRDRGLPAAEWLDSYVTTYVERDVRSVLQVGDLLAFQAFLRVCAGRTAQLLNLSALAADIGTSHNTVRSWISVLEATYLAIRLPPLHVNVTSRAVKTPKLHFLDSGLVCRLLGITSAQQLRVHPLRGAVFESWVVSEVLKARLHHGLPPALCFYRDGKGLEVDLVVERSRGTLLVEAKSAETIAPDFFRPVQALRRSLGDGRPVVVYGGAGAQRRSEADVVPWSKLPDFDWLGV